MGGIELVQHPVTFAGSMENRDMSSQVEQFLSTVTCHFKWKPCQGDPDANPEMSIQHLTDNLKGGGHYSSPESTKLLIGYLNTLTDPPNYQEALRLFDDVIITCATNDDDHFRDEMLAYKSVATANKIHALFLQSAPTTAVFNTLENEVDNYRLEFPAPASKKWLATVTAMEAFASVHFGIEKYDRCLELFARAVDLDPTNHKWLIDHAFVAGRIRICKVNAVSSSPSEEERVLRRAIEMTDEKDSVPMIMLADICLYQKKYQEAKDLYKKAVNLDPESPNVLMNYGKGLSQMGHTEEATKVLQKAINLDPTSSRALFRMGVHYAKSNSREVLMRAEEYFERAIVSGRRRHFYAEEKLGKLKKRLDSTFDLRQYFESMKENYPSEEHQNKIQNLLKNLH